MLKWLRGPPAERLFPGILIAKSYKVGNSNPGATSLFTKKNNYSLPIIVVSKSPKPFDARVCCSILEIFGGVFSHHSILSGVKE